MALRALARFPRCRRGIGAHRARNHSLASVASQKYADGGVEVEARVPAKYSERFREWELRKKS